MLSNLHPIISIFTSRSIVLQIFHPVFVTLSANPDSNVKMCHPGQNMGLINKQ